MERYREYKESGVKWLGEIPSHWELRKMKYTFSERSQKGFPQEPLLASTQTHGVILKSQYENRTVEAIKSLETLKLVEIGDFVISLRSFQGGLEYAYNRGIISPAYTILTPTHIKADYFKYLSKSDIFISLLKSTVTGIREGQNIDYNKLKDNLLPIPSEKEQISIGSYLDTATSEIDKAIAMQQKMIDLLNERKQIIIQNAVTKGLDENVEMKESGVEWIGKIPKHWGLVKIKHLAKLQSGSNLTSNDISDIGLYPVYGGNGQRGYYNRYNCEGSYILIGRQGALCGNINYAEGKFWATEHAVVCYPKKGYNTLWLGETLRLMNLGQYSLATAQPGLAVERINGLYLPYPALEEQNGIALFLKNKIDKIDLYAKYCQRQITLLQERKQIIINEVVTGKVRVS